MDAVAARLQRPFADEARFWRVSPRIALALFAFPFAGVLLAVAEVAHRGLGHRLLAEDSVVEWGTALAILATAAPAAIVARRLWLDGRRAQAVVYASLSAAAVVAAGEEISWGQRLFDLDTPEPVREANRQGELNIHNLDGVYGPYVAGMLLVGLYGSVGSWFVHRFRRLRNPDWHLFVPPVFLAGAFLQLAAYRLSRYTGVDGHNYGEWCELCVAVALLVFVALNARRLRCGAAPA